MGLIADALNDFHEWRRQTFVDPFMGSVDDERAEGHNEVARAWGDESKATQSNLNSVQAWSPAGTSSDEKLRTIARLLFPPALIEELSDGTIVAVDHSVDSNLDAALDDLTSCYNDDAPQRTIRRAVAVLQDVRLLLDERVAYPEGATKIFFAGIGGHDPADDAAEQR